MGGEVMSHFSSPAASSKPGAHGSQDVLLMSMSLAIRASFFHDIWTSPAVPHFSSFCVSVHLEQQTLYTLSPQSQKQWDRQALFKFWTEIAIKFESHYKRWERLLLYTCRQHLHRTHLDSSKPTFWHCRWSELWVKGITGKEGRRYCPQPPQPQVGTNFWILNHPGYVSEDTWFSIQNNGSFIKCKSQLHCDTKRWDSRFITFSSFYSIHAFS